jgi:RHH-type proline utilization regulon transcriptional repressor/proline dehydrogenase/delta 1-pyrroline-5-carboxylate dehydrogenase
VLHVLRYRRTDLDQLLDAINATGYGLTFGLHSRIDETIAHVLGRIRAGNRYVNRNIIGAVVGVHPFGGSGLSGTGPKAGGPLYLGRLVRRPPAASLDGLGTGDTLLCPYAAWLRSKGHGRLAEALSSARYPASAQIDLPGPVGERNLYGLRARGRVAAIAATEPGLFLQVGAILACGNRAVVVAPEPIRAALRGLPEACAARVDDAPALEAAGNIAAILFEGDADVLRALNRTVAARAGAILPVQARTPEALVGGDLYTAIGLVDEVSTAVNTAAAGGNASLMSVG